MAGVDRGKTPLDGRFMGLDIVDLFFNHNLPGFQSFKYGDYFIQFFVGSHNSFRIGCTELLNACVFVAYKIQLISSSINCLARIKATPAKCRIEKSVLPGFRRLVVRSAIPGFAWGQVATKEQPDFTRFRVKKLCQDLHVVTLPGQPWLQPVNILGEHICDHIRADRFLPDLVRFLEGARQISIRIAAARRVFR